MNNKQQQSLALSLRGETYPEAVAFQAILLALRLDGANVLTSVTITQSPKAMHEYGLTAVEIDLKPRAKEIWQDPRWPKDQYALTHRGLKKIWNAAGGKWIRSQRLDDRNERFWVEYLAEGAIKDLEGEWQSCIKTAHLDYRDKAPDVAGWTDKQVLEARKKYIERCESVAQNRVMRELLNLGDAYTLDELKQPFVLAKVVFRPDLRDPATRRDVLRISMGATAALYGPEDTLRQTFGELSEEIDNPEAPPEIEAPPVADDAFLDFVAADRGVQSQILLKQAEAKNYDLAQLSTPPDQMTIRQRVNFYRLLASSPDAPSRPA